MIALPILRVSCSCDLQYGIKMMLDLQWYGWTIKQSNGIEFILREFRGNKNGTSLVCYQVILYSKFISKSLLKCMDLETTFDLSFRRFIP